MIFAVVVPRRPAPESRGPLGRHLEAAADTRRVPSDEAVKGKVLPTRTPVEPYFFVSRGAGSRAMGCAAPRIITSLGEPPRHPEKGIAPWRLKRSGR